MTDVDSFTQLYWREQFASAGALIVLSVGGALGGGLMYASPRNVPRTARHRRPPERSRRPA